MHKNAIILSLLLLTYLFMPGNALAVKVTIPPAQAYNGDTVEVRVEIDHAEALAGYQLTLTYDTSVMMYVNYAEGDVSAGWTFMENSAPGRIVIAAYNLNLGSAGNPGGSIARFTFNVTGSPGMNADIDIASVKLSDKNGKVIPAGKNSGLFHTMFVDSDADGRRDDIDVCPETYNPDQTDSDGDGIGNACELWA